MNIQTVNQLITVFKDAANRHYQINGFGYGDNWEVGASEAKMHPVLWINPVSATMAESENNIGYKTFEIDFEIRVFDLVDKDESNEDEVLSDSVDILKDIITEFKGHPYYTNSKLNIVNDIEFEPFTEEFDEEVTGWVCEISFKTPLINTWCGLPMAEIDGFSFPDAACDGYNAVCDATYVEDIIGIYPIEVTQASGNTKIISIDTSALAVSADNGLNVQPGNVVELGGKLNKNTTISGDTFNLNLGTSDSRINNLDINAITSTQNFTTPGFGSIENVYTPNGLTTTTIDSTGNFTNIFTINSNQTRTEASDTSGNKLTYVDVSNNQLQGSSTDTATGQNSSFAVAPNQTSFIHNNGGVVNNNLFLTDNSVLLSHTSGATTNAIFITESILQIDGPTTNLTFGVNDTTFTDTRTVTKGIEYAADYSAGWTNNSLITKQYVDDSIAALPSDNLYTADGSLTGNRLLNMGLNQNLSIVGLNSNFIVGNTITKACEQISLQYDTLISGELVIHAPSSPISDSCLIDDSYSIYFENGELKARYKDSASTVSDVSFKMSNLNNGEIYVGDATNTAQSVPMSGDVHIDNAGVTTIQPDSVTYDKMQDVTQSAVLGSTNPVGGTVTEIQTFEQYLTAGTNTALLENTANWDVNGNYIGTSITGTYQGQAHYDADYWFTAVADNVWIRLVRG